MGGYGSGRWDWHNAKQTVEDGLKLPISEFKKGLIYIADANSDMEWRGNMTWSRMGHQFSAIGFRIIKVSYTVGSERGGIGPQVHLSYTTTFRDGTKTDSDYPVQTIWTRPNFGGKRWWWICPVGKNNRSCKRRVSKLYLPPGATYFGCRMCYDLTYTSCKESHKYDSLFAGLAASMSDRYPGMTGRDVEKLLNRRS